MTHLETVFRQRGTKGGYLFLIDEAHNLVERGRQMYSASLYKEDFLSVKKLVKKMSQSLAKELQNAMQSCWNIKERAGSFSIMKIFLRLCLH